MQLTRDLFAIAKFLFTHDVIILAPVHVGKVEIRDIDSIMTDAIGIVPLRTHYKCSVRTFIVVQLNYKNLKIKLIALEHIQNV